LQYGTKEVFAEMRAILRRSPNTRIFLSPTWANGTDVLLRFFMPSEPRAQILNIDAFLAQKLELTGDMLLIMPPDEYERASRDPKFTAIRVEQTLKYPDGREGFYFVRMRYSPEADQIFAAEQKALLEPVIEEFILNGETVTIAHTRFDIGELHDLFDADAFTLVRTQGINPAVIEVTFSQPRPLAGLSLTTGTKDFNLTAQLFAQGASEPVTYTQAYRSPPPDPTVELDFDDAPGPVSRIRIEVEELTTGDDAHVHIRDLVLR
jgi:hypothetical protein